jgi:hypothetical protein
LLCAFESLQKCPQLSNELRKWHLCLKSAKLKLTLFEFWHNFFRKFVNMRILKSLMIQLSPALKKISVHRLIFDLLQIKHWFSNFLCCFLKRRAKDLTDKMSKQSFFFVRQTKIFHLSQCKQLKCHGKTWTTINNNRFNQSELEVIINLFF